MSRGIPRICRGKPRNLSNDAAEFSIICRGKLWALLKTLQRRLNGFVHYRPVDSRTTDTHVGKPLSDEMNFCSVIHYSPPNSAKYPSVILSLKWTFLETTLSFSSVPITMLDSLPFIHSLSTHAGDRQTISPVVCTLI